MGREWRLLGAIGYGLPLASSVMVGMASMGVGGSVRLGLFLWLSSLLFAGSAWILLGLDAEQKGYVLVGVVGLLAFALNLSIVKGLSELIFGALTMNPNPLHPPSPWALALSISLAIMHQLFEIVAMAHAGGTFGEKFLNWSAWAKALAIGLSTLALLSFLPLASALFEAFRGRELSLMSFAIPLIGLIVGGVSYIMSTLFAMIGFLDLKVNR